MKYLFRRPGSHVFITTEDPEYRYEVLCGRCDYPLAQEDDCCPRCQVALEECPVCSARTHTKAPRVEPDARTGSKTCPVCEVRRLPFGGQPLAEVAGSFCTNVYGCPAGGLLLRTEELAVLPPDATLCPVCRSEALLPLDVRTYVYLISRCLFCSTCFGPSRSWTRGWSRSWNPRLEAGLDGFEGHDLCPLCGRNDHLDRRTRRIVSLSVNSQGIEEKVSLPIGQYLRLVELGRVMILEGEDGSVFTKAFEVWFDPLGKGPEDPITVARIAEHLLAETLRPETRRMLQRRLEPFLAAWERKLPSGLNYSVAASAVEVATGSGPFHSPGGEEEREVA